VVGSLPKITLLLGFGLIQIVVFNFESARETSGSIHLICSSGIIFAISVMVMLILQIGVNTEVALTVATVYA